MINRINFAAGSFDHLEFENKLLEKEITYVKSEGTAFRLTYVISFYFEEEDYKAALELADSMNLTSMYRTSGSVLSYYPDRMTWRLIAVFLLVICIVLLYIKIMG